MTSIRLTRNIINNPYSYSAIKVLGDMVTVGKYITIGFCYSDGGEPFEIVSVETFNKGKGSDVDDEYRILVSNGKWYRSNTFDSCYKKNQENKQKNENDDEIHVTFYSEAGKDGDYQIEFFDTLEEAKENGSEGYIDKNGSIESKESDNDTDSDDDTQNIIDNPHCYSAIKVFGDKIVVGKYITIDFFHSIKGKPFQIVSVETFNKGKGSDVDDEYRILVSNGKWYRSSTFDPYFGDEGDEEDNGKKNENKDDIFVEFNPEEGKDGDHQFNFFNTFEEAKESGSEGSLDEDGFIQSIKQNSDSDEDNEDEDNEDEDDEEVSNDLSSVNIDE